VQIKCLVATSIACLLAACSSSSSHGNSQGSGAGGSSLLPQPGTAGGAAVGSSDPFAEGASCSMNAETRSCCSGKGMQKCSGTAEFLMWGPCLDAKGATVTCKIDQPTGCGIGEFATKCDAGTDSGIPHKCGEGEFGPSCTPPPGLCTNKEINTEPEILAGYSPANGAAVGATGQIKVWINDERASLIALNEQIDPMTGRITAPGDRTGKAPDGYLWEPALYIAPETAESGGTPHFPQQIKGWYNNMPPYVRGSSMTGIEVPGMDPAPAGTKLSERYTTEDIWDVSALGLKPGTYSAEFVIHDGDRDRAIGCVTITIN
jgi:hypothetical protein